MCVQGVIYPPAYIRPLHPRRPDGWARLPAPRREPLYGSILRWYFSGQVQFATQRRGGRMMREVSAPIRRTTDELDREIESLKEQMAPLTVEHLRRLRDAGAIEYDEERLLDRYDTCMWLRYGVA